MSYTCYDVTQLDRREANIFIIVSSVGMSLSINHMVKTCWCSFVIQASVRSVLSIRSSNKCSLMYDPTILTCCNTLKCASLTKL
jgi:hypothetical protein